MYTDGLFLSKTYNVSAREFRKNYVSWQWKVMPDLKENWLVTWKITQIIWLIFMRAVDILKICTLRSSFCPKHTKIYVKMYRRVMQSLKKNWLLVPKMTWWIWWILARAVESLKVCTAGYFCKKYVMLELKKYRGVVSYGFLSFWFQKWHKEFGEFSYN